MAAYAVKKIGNRYYPIMVFEDGNHKEFTNPRHGGPRNYAHQSSAMRFIRKYSEGEMR